MASNGRPAQCWQRGPYPAAVPATDAAVRRKVAPTLSWMNAPGGHRSQATDDALTAARPILEGLLPAATR